MNKLLIIILGIGALLGVWVGKANACDSYEECMEKSKNWNYQGVQAGVIDIASLASIYQLRALAYKLDEISKKLGPNPEELQKVIDLVHKEGGLVHGLDKLDNKETYKIVNDYRDKNGNEITKEQWKEITSGK